MVCNCHVIRRSNLLAPRYYHPERDAFGADEYHPISQKGSNLTAAGGIGYTVADSLDTIILMQQQGYDLDAEYERAKTWIRDTLSFDRDANFNTFEVCLVYPGFMLQILRLLIDHNTCTWRVTFGALLDVR